MDEESISSVLKLSDELRQHQNYRKTIDQLHDKASSILFLTVQWKEIEDQFDSERRLIEEKEKGLLSVQESVKERLQEVERKERDFTLKEKELEVVQDLVREGFEGMQEKQKELEGMKEFVNDRWREIEVRERKWEGIQEFVNEKFGEIGDRERGIELKEKELEGIEESIKQRIREVEVQEGEIDMKDKELEGIREKMAERLKEVERKEKELDGIKESIKVKEAEVEEKSEQLKLKDQDVGKRFKEFSIQKKTFEEDCKEFKLKDERILERLKEIELKEEEIQKRCKGVDLDEKKLEGKWKELRMKELKFEEQCKRVSGLKERKSVNTHTRIEPKKDHIVENAMNSMDGKALQVLLNENVCSRNEVKVILRIASDPAMLVLKAMEGFYPPHLKKGELEFEGGVIRRSCILLLEQLMRISPEISPQVKKEAIKLASDWTKRMRVDTAHSSEVLGFLQLLASYRLKSAFSSDRILKYLEFISHHNQAPQLFCALGFADKISDFIQNLIGRKLQIGAVNFIYAFHLANEFPPRPLLKEYLNDSRMAAMRMGKRNNSVEVQIETINKRIADLRAVLRCVEDHKMESELLPSELSPKDLEKQIEFWENENSHRKIMLQDLGRDSQRSNSNERKCLTGKFPAVASTPMIDAKSASATNTSCPSNSSTAVSASIPTKLVTISTTSPTTTAMPTSTTTVTSQSRTINAPPEFIHKIEQKRQAGKKRPLVSVTSETHRKGSFRNGEYVYSSYPPRKKLAGLVINQGAPRNSSLRFRAEREKTSEA